MTPIESYIYDGDNDAKVIEQRAKVVTSSFFFPLFLSLNKGKKRETTL
jgi:hypothetical protein